jgi:gluconate kinase|tara:strand:- start:333 stop:515 length:183 start_codon:yes stop_codon:yes gene_type:complete
MPMKYKKSQKTRDKNTGKTRTEHFYVKQLMDNQLKDLMDSSSTRPKVKLKIRNELTRRNK